MGGFFGGLVDTVTAPFTGSQREKEAMDQANAISRENSDYIKGIDLPQLDWVNYKPEDMDYKTLSEDPKIRGMQLSALSKMAGLSDKGLSDEDVLGFEKARAEGDQMARSGTQAAMENANARGVGGSGMEMAMREAANQAGAERARAGAMDQAATAARNRAMYTQAFGQQAGAVRGADLTANEANTDIINKFNAANTQARNDAQKYNLQGRQNTTQQTYENDLNKRKAVAGMNDQVRQNYLAQASSAQQDENNLWGLASTGAKAALA
jgi:hypothetical protein